jgi:hypothetical protein
MKERVHFIAMGGEHGCLPDNCEAYDNNEDACDSLANIYELDNQQLETLKETGYVDLYRNQGGAYCSVDECNCPFPWEHCSSDEPGEWGEYREKEEESD